MFFYQLKSGFPQHGLRRIHATVSRPKADSAVLWVTRHTSCAHFRTWGPPISGRCAPPHHHASWASELPSTARARRTPFEFNVKGSEVSSPKHDARPLDLTLRVVRFPAPSTPHSGRTPRLP